MTQILNKTLFKRYIAYLIRWQLSTPILTIAILYFIEFGALWSTVIANVIGGIIFFWIDRFIFKSDVFVYKGPIWDVVQLGFCDKCGKVGRLYRLVKYDKIGYDRIKDKNPQFLCEKCSKEKYNSMNIKI